MPIGMGGFNPSLGIKAPLIGQGLPPGVPGVAGGFTQQNPAEVHRQRIKNIIKDKASFQNMPLESTKRLLSEPLRFLIEETGIPSTQSGNFLSKSLPM